MFLKVSLRNRPSFPATALHRSSRTADIRLPGKGNSNSHGGRAVHKKYLDDQVFSDQEVFSKELSLYTVPCQVCRHTVARQKRLRAATSQDWTAYLSLSSSPSLFKTCWISAIKTLSRQIRHNGFVTNPPKWIERDIEREKHWLPLAFPVQTL